MDLNAYREPDYIFPELPKPGATIEVMPGIHWVRMPLPFALNHVNLWLLEDGDGWTLVDTGYGSPEIRDLWQRVLASVLGGRPLKRIVVTHYHPDHVGNAAWFIGRHGAELWMTETEFWTAHSAYHRLAAWDGGTVELFERHGLEGERLEALARWGNGYRRGVPELPSRFRRIMEGDIITIHDREWRVIVGHGHAPEHAALYCEELQVLISGDQVLPRISTNVSVHAPEPEGDPLRLFLQSLGTFRPLPEPTLVLPSHGKVFRGLHARLDALGDHHDRRLEDLWQACAEPQSAATLLPVLFQRPLDTHQVYFAMGEAVAHLNHLMYRGRVERLVEQDGALRFCRS